MKLIWRPPDIDDASFWRWFLYCVQGIAIALLGMICIEYASNHQPEPQGVEQSD